MKRIYSNGEHENIEFFVGFEVEHTPAWGKYTLFVTGAHSAETVESLVNDHDVDHIFFGANHSYNPHGVDEHSAWEEMIKYFLDKQYLCTLDIPINQVEEFNDSCLCEYNNFIPQIRVPIPYFKLWNYNTTIKIDDIGFDQTNPGVWCHSLHSLTNYDKFTNWTEYSGDKIISPK